MAQLSWRLGMTAWTARCHPAPTRRGGWLSASRLNDPLLWQVLYVLGVPQKPIDEYTLRKFLRGNHVEDWLLSNMDCIDKQKFRPLLKTPPDELNQ